MKKIKTVRDLANFMDINDNEDGLSKEWVDNRQISVTEDTGVFDPKRSYLFDGFKVLNDGLLILEFIFEDEENKEPKLTLGALRDVLTNETLLDSSKVLIHLRLEDGSPMLIDELTELDKGHSSNVWYIEIPEI